MQHKNLKKISIGWDIGGAHIKYCVESDDSKLIWYDILPFDFWRDYKKLKNLIRKVNSLYKKKKSAISNYFTMSAEMCDCFDNRDIGVKFIIQQIIESKCTSYIFSRNGFIKPNDISRSLLRNIGSYNWYSTALYLSNSYSDVIAIDYGSTTCDFIIIKNGNIKNKRTSDLSGLQTKELLYSGCARTPIYSNINEINYKGQIYKIIPEQFSSMSDINIILNTLKIKDIYSKTADGTLNNKINAFKRVSRSFGFDYSKNKRDLIKHLASQIYNSQIDLIKSHIIYHMNQHFPDKKNVKIIGIGLGHEIISNISSKEKLPYLDINNILESEIKGGTALTRVYPSYVMCRLNK
jgi:probable H4MPT-linked C1 transfer pathway protein